jgi:hypothetical protein
LEYWKKNYMNPQEEARILQYIVDTFDINYAAVAHAHHCIAVNRHLAGNYGQSLAEYKAFNQIDVQKLYCLPLVSSNFTIILSAEKNFSENYKNIIEMDRKSSPNAMLDAAASMDVPVAIAELRALRKMYLTDDALRKKIEEQLRELSLKSDLIIPAEELGLPQVTTNTLTTSGTLSASPKK